MALTRVRILLAGTAETAIAGLSLFWVRGQERQVGLSGLCGPWEPGLLGVAYTSTSPKAK